jgi:hypothetical protein
MKVIAVPVKPSVEIKTRIVHNLTLAVVFPGNSFKHLKIRDKICYIFRKNLLLIVAYYGIMPQ